VQLEAECGCLITTGLFGESKYGDPDFMPTFEWLEHHTQSPCNTLSQLRRSHPPYRFP
jgi:hypothetical protein